MVTKNKKYLEILKIELKDLISDLELSENVLSKRLEKHEVSEYVFRGNLNLLKKQILGIERVRQKLDEPGMEVYTINELRDKIEFYFDEEIKSSGLPEVVFEMVSRKLDKIARYMSIGD